MQVLSQRANKPSSMLVGLGCGDVARALESKLCMARSERLSWPIDHAHVLSKEPQTLLCAGRSITQYEDLVGEKALQSKWSKDLCFKRFVQIPQSTYPASGHTPIRYQVSKSIPISPVRDTLKYVFNLLHTYHYLSDLIYTVLIKPFVSPLWQSPWPPDHVMPETAQARNGEKAKRSQTNGFRTILHKLHGESRFLSNEAQWGKTFLWFGGNNERRHPYRSFGTAGSRVPLFQGAVLVFRIDKKQRTQSQTQRLKPNSHCCLEWGFTGLIENQFLFGNRCVDPIWAETAGNVAIYKCLASSLLLSSLPATSAKRLWLAWSFDCIPFN